MLRDQIVKTRAGGGTPFMMQFTKLRKTSQQPARPPGDQPDIVRRVMILISDGEDNFPITLAGSRRNGAAHGRRYLHHQHQHQWVRPPEKIGATGTANITSPTATKSAGLPKNAARLLSVSRG